MNLFTIFHNVELPQAKYKNYRSPIKIKALLLIISLSLVSFSAIAETVNINKANAAALQHYLVGVGEKKSQSIVEYGKEHKKFTKIDQIKEVKGIGDAIFKKIKSSLSLTKGAVSVPVKMAKKKATPKKVKVTKSKIN